MTGYDPVDLKVGVPGKNRKIVATSLISSLLHSHVNLEWCDKIKLSSLLLPRKSGTMKRASPGSAFLNGSNDFSPRWSHSGFPYPARELYLRLTELVVVIVFCRICVLGFATFRISRSRCLFVALLYFLM